MFKDKKEYLKYLLDEYEQNLVDFGCDVSEAKFDRYVMEYNLTSDIIENKE